MDTQLEREFQEKQEMEEQRELCLALQLGSECFQLRKPLTKVLSLPSNFTYNPPGSRHDAEQQPSLKARRQTLHSQQPITLSHLDDIKIIDKSVIYDIYNIDDYDTNIIPVKNLTQTNLDEIINVSQHEHLLKLPDIEEKYLLKNINESCETNLLLGVPTETKPLNRRHGSTKQLFTKQKSFEITEETPFLLSTYLVPDAKPQADVETEELKILKIPKHDSQESVQRIITERRKLDENLKDINQYDIFDITHGSEENLVKNDSDDKQECANYDEIHEAKNDDR
ncbi:hypothetical protein RN001_014177 [Aquatica leii]|uniref:Uncharacterized protein n=1 Tax=Aquatica leii TaxID=1421715 RepID=A0AAN7SCR0_9COLE|nr:hypothetical protein RN001_014177 [Aquatica leii]